MRFAPSSLAATGGKASPRQEAGGPCRCSLHLYAKMILDDAVFPHCEAKVFYDFGNDNSTEWLVEEIIGHQWEGNKCQFHVSWTLGDHTWEPYEHCKELVALDEYCHLMGVTLWRALPKRGKSTTPK